MSNIILPYKVFPYTDVSDMIMAFCLEESEEWVPIWKKLKRKLNVYNKIHNLDESIGIITSCHGEMHKYGNHMVPYRVINIKLK